MGCNCKKINNKKDFENIYKDTISISQVNRERAKLIMLFILFSPIFLVSSIIKLLTNGKKLQNKG